MGSASKQAAAERRARIEQLRQEEKRRERRNKIIASAVGGTLLLGMVGGGIWIVMDAKKKDEVAKGPVDGVRTFSGLSNKHVDGKVSYKQTPPVGGDHNPVWLDCMGTVYDQPVANENAVHGLEHGAVWISYSSKATADDIAALKKKVDGKPYTFMSPYPSQPGTVMLSAWGTQLTVDNAKDPRIDRFLTKYVQGPQTLEPGASCTADGPMNK